MGFPHDHLFLRRRSPAAAISALVLLCIDGRNGDRLTGVVVKMEDGVLTLKTDYGGEIRISWVEVTAVTSTTPMQVKVSTQVNEFLRDFLLGGYELIETNKLGPAGRSPTDVL